mgnify:CR=1 FL=1
MTNNTTEDILKKRMTDDLFTTLGNITRKSLSYTLLEKLIDLIMDGTLKPGFTFPNEKEMYKHLGVSRSTLRETYTALMAMGFISRTKAGTKVNNNAQIIASVPLNYMFKKSELQYIYEFRSMLETQCAQLAALRADDEAIQKLADIIDEMRTSGSNHDIDSLTRLDLKFHSHIASTTGNPLLKNTLIAVTDEYENSAYTGYCLDQRIIDQSINFHQQIYDAIKARDAELARIRMQSHINNIYQVLEKVSLEST